MAPGANIVLLTSPVSETEGVQGMPEFLALEEYALGHKLGKIISQSWGATENTLFTPAGQQVFENFEDFYQRAAQEHVTVLASTGDFGSLTPMSMATSILFQRWATPHRRHKSPRWAVPVCTQIRRATTFTRLLGLPAVAE